MIRNPPPTVQPAVSSPAVSTVTHASRFNERGPQGEKNNELFRQQAEGKLDRLLVLFHACIYSCDCVSVCFCHFFVCFAVGLALHGRGDKWWVTRQAGGADAVAQLSVCFLSFTPSLCHFFQICLPELGPPFCVFLSCKSLFLLPSSIHLSLSLMNISRRKTIYRPRPCAPSVRLRFLICTFRSVIIRLMLSFVSLSIIISSEMKDVFLCVAHARWRLRSNLFHHGSTFINVFVTEMI